MKTFALLLALAVCGCSAEHYEARARIIERRVVEGEGLVIKYTFRAGDETITDSVRTRNKVIPHDSVTVRYSPSDPRKNTLKID